MKKTLVPLALLICIGSYAQTESNDPKATEVWEPKPPKVQTMEEAGAAPSDAIILFNGKNLDEWVSVKDSTKPAMWTVANNMLTVKKGTGNIRTKKSFLDYQLHLEWKIPETITGEGQARGNSGLFLSSTGGGDSGYELQIMDNYNNETYVNGQSGSIYKQAVPLASPSRKPGEWQTYDVIWTAPRFNADGSLKTPAYVTVIFNGVLVQNHYQLTGPTQYVGKAAYRKPQGATPIKLQDHGDPSEPISFRNIWIRNL